MYTSQLLQGSEDRLQCKGHSLVRTLVSTSLSPVDIVCPFALGADTFIWLHLLNIDRDQQVANLVFFC